MYKSQIKKILKREESPPFLAKSPNFQLKKKCYILNLKNFKFKYQKKNLVLVHIYS